MASACSVESLDICPMVATTSSTPETTSERFLAVSSAIFVPLRTARREFSIRADVLFDASADLLARLLTSSATTAKPFPASPALAASTAAFNANILVWKAMSSMVLIIFPISLEELLISSMACIMSCIWRLLSVIRRPISTAFSLALRAFSAFRLIRDAISFTVAATSSMELACSVEPCDKDCAPMDTCSEPEDTCSAASLISPIVLLREWIIVNNDSSIVINAPLYFSLGEILKLPWDISLSPLDISVM